MKLSYWEYKTWFSNIDFTIVGSGIVGLNCALSLRVQYPNAKIIIVEKGQLPEGASTKNAGFACFGSLSELIDDLATHSEEEVVSLVEKRWKGLQLLRKTIGDTALDYKAYGGYEFFNIDDKKLLEDCLQHLPAVNKLIAPIFKKPVFEACQNKFSFQKIQQQGIFNAFEGQIDTGKMMESLLLKVYASGIKIINSTKIISYSEANGAVYLTTDKLGFKTNKLLIATNGFAKQLLQEDVKPARAQVLITKPIPNLSIKGTFHLDKGYYYFRNIDNRILLGGGRNLDFKGEETSVFGQTALIQHKLESLLKENILPNTPFEIAQRWSGIMGVGKQKKALLKQLSSNVYCGVRLGGMGVAIGSLIGKELAELLKK